MFSVGRLGGCWRVDAKLLLGPGCERQAFDWWEGTDRVVPVAVDLQLRQMAVALKRQYASDRLTACVKYGRLVRYRITDRVARQRIRDGKVYRPAFGFGRRAGFGRVLSLSQPVCNPSTPSLDDESQ
jgi:hypothetical protein